MLIHLNVLGILNKRIIFLCTGNSCRSQIAEGLAKKYMRTHTIKSAGTRPEPINPLAIEIMNEINIDISNYKSKSFTDRDLEGYDLIITLCGDAKDKCPIISKAEHIHWNIPDPAKCKGSQNKIELTFSKVRDMIYNHIVLLEKIDKD